MTARKAPAKKLEVVPDPPVEDPADQIDVTYDRVQGLVNGLLDEIEYIMEHGNMQAKMTLAKQVMPVLMKELQNHSEASKDANARDDFMGVMREIRATLGGTPDA